MKIQSYLTFLQEGKISDSYIRNVIHEALQFVDVEIKKNDLKDNLHLYKDLGMDHLDVVEMMIQIETIFWIEITDREIKRMKTIGDIVRFIKSHNLTTEDLAKKEKGYKEYERSQPQFDMGEVVDSLLNKRGITKNSLFKLFQKKKKGLKIFRRK